MNKNIFNVLLVMIAFSAVGSTQLTLQYEKSNSLKVKRYTVGSTLRFKTKAMAKWQESEIDKILLDERASVFADRITYLRDITHISYERKWAKGLGKSITQFGIVWLSLAALTEGAKAIGALRSDFDVGADTIGVGLGAVVTGIVLNRGFGTARKRLSDNRRLRIVDLDF